MPGIISAIRLLKACLPAGGSDKLDEKDTPPAFIPLDMVSI
jgi:hypothetical protein